jgi:hypothetical protein
MDQPPGYIDPRFPHHVCRLKRALYGLKQAPRAWFQRFSSFLLQLGFLISKADSSLFVHHSAAGTVYLLLYVDDMVLTGSNPSLIKTLITRLSNEFAMKDLGLYTISLVSKATITHTIYFLAKPNMLLISSTMLTWLRPNPLPLLMSWVSISPLKGSYFQILPFFGLLLVLCNI